MGAGFWGAFFYRPGICVIPADSPLSHEMSSLSHAIKLSPWKKEEFLLPNIAQRERDQEKELGYRLTERRNNFQAKTTFQLCNARSYICMDFHHLQII